MIWGQGVRFRSKGRPGLIVSGAIVVGLSGQFILHGCGYIIGRQGKLHHTSVDFLAGTHSRQSSYSEIPAILNKLTIKVIYDSYMVRVAVFGAKCLWRTDDEYTTLCK